jgi:hypothetical protein
MFLCKALQHMQNDPSVELHVCFKRSYDEVLSHHHTFIVRSLAVVRHFFPLDFRCAWSVGLPVAVRWCRSPLGRFLTAEISLLASRKEGTGRSST